MSSGMQQQQVFYDEEECLGFGVFVAELELIVGTSKGKKADQTVLLELLQKLQASITSTARDPASLKQHQKRCEAALYDIVYKGSCAAVRVSSRRTMQQQSGNSSSSSTLAELEQRGSEQPPSSPSLSPTCAACNL
jgi:hypothetical protein